MAVARAFAAEGCNLHLAARSEDALKNAKEELSRKHGVSVAIHPMDLGKSENILELGRRCADVDILVNNAGEIPSGPIEAPSAEGWRPRPHL